MRRIGILGGTFDPVHNAHLALARCALEQYQLEGVLFIPAGRPVRKMSADLTSAEHRLNMLELACKNVREFSVETLEIMRSQPSYTSVTLELLAKRYGKDTQLFLILGEDTAADLGTWKDSKLIAQCATILYARRPGITKAQPLPEGFTCYKIDMQQYDLSSSEVRRRLFAGENMSPYIPQAVQDYIERHQLYAQFERDI